MMNSRTNSTNTTVSSDRASTTVGGDRTGGAAHPNVCHHSIERKNPSQDLPSERPAESAAQFSTLVTVSETLLVVVVLRSKNFLPPAPRNPQETHFTPQPEQRTAV